MAGFPEEKREQYLNELPKLGEKARILLFDMLTKYYIIDNDEKRAIKALEVFRNYAKDLDYDKLTAKLGEIDGKEEV